MLIPTEKRLSPPSSPSPVDQELADGLSDTDHSAAFTFPVLTPEGSVHLQRRPPFEDPSSGSSRFDSIVPLATLSELAGKTTMASYDLAESVGSLAESHYDMLDDVSESSIDDHETASLASTPQVSDAEETYTILEDTGSIVDLMEEHPRDHPWQQGNGYQTVYGSISEDLDTPKQSVMREDSSAASRVPSSRPETPLSKPFINDQKSDRCHLRPSDQKERTDQKSGAVPWYLKHIVSSAILVCFAIAQLVVLFSPSPAAQLSSRREDLSSALNKYVDSENASDVFNIEHLLPSVAESQMRGLSGSVRHQGIPPNILIISILKEPGGRGFPQANATKVYRANGKSLSFNLTNLIDGVYGVTISHEDAHGEVWVNMLVNNPHMNATLWHDFGRRQFTINIPDTVSLAKVASKELSLVYEVTKSWKHKLAIPFNAGVIATMNMTTELATSMRKDLQVFGNTALSVLTKAAHETNITITSMRKDFILVQKDLTVWKDQVQKSLSTTAGTIKALIPTTNGFANSLARSRSRASRLRRGLVNSKTAAEKLTATKHAIITARENFVQRAKKWQRDRQMRRSAKARKAETGLSIPHKDATEPLPKNGKPSPDLKKDKLSQKLKHKRLLRNAQRVERNAAKAELKKARKHDKVGKHDIR